MGLKPLLIKVPANPINSNFNAHSLFIQRSNRHKIVNVASVRDDINIFVPLYRHNNIFK